MRNNAEKYGYVKAGFVSRLVTAVLIFTVMLFGNVSREWVHTFAGHHDTVHHDHPGDHFEPEHHHCKFLEIPTPVFIHFSSYTLSLATLQHFSAYTEYEANAYTSCHERYSSPRGPPVV